MTGAAHADVNLTGPLDEAAIEEFTAGTRKAIEHNRQRPELDRRRDAAVERWSE